MESECEMIIEHLIDHPDAISESPMDTFSTSKARRPRKQKVDSSIRPSNPLRSKTNLATFTLSKRRVKAIGTGTENVGQPKNPFPMSVCCN